MIYLVSFLNPSPAWIDFAFRGRAVDLYDRHALRLYYWNSI